MTNTKDDFLFHAQVKWRALPRHIICTRWKLSCRRVPKRSGRVEECQEELFVPFLGGPR